MLQADKDYSLESMDKAYRRGYMSGVTGNHEQCPYETEVLIAAWEAGFDDGHEFFLEHQERLIA
jgi:ribosome modulation factor